MPIPIHLYIYIYIERERDVGRGVCNMRLLESPNPLFSQALA